MHHDLSFATDFKTLVNYFPDVSNDVDFSNQFSVNSSIEPDTSRCTAICMDPADQTLAWHNMTWGSIPFDLHDDTRLQRRWAFMLYASGDRIFSDIKSYWHRIRKHRCLIPVTGIYVHKFTKGEPKGIPYFVHMPDQPVIFLPALYSVENELNITKGDNVLRWVFTIIIRPANRMLSQLHGKGVPKGSMPLLLPLSQSRRWLAHDLSEVEYNSLLDFEMPSEALQVWPIYSTCPGEERPDHKEKNDRFDWRSIYTFKSKEI